LGVILISFSEPISPMPPPEKVSVPMPFVVVFRAVVVTAEMEGNEGLAGLVTLLIGRRADQVHDLLGVVSDNYLGR
jgi:hypothetical protein